MIYVATEKISQLEIETSKKNYRQTQIGTKKQFQKLKTEKNRRNKNQN